MKRLAKARAHIGAAVILAGIAAALAALGVASYSTQKTFVEKNASEQLAARVGSQADLIERIVGQARLDAKVIAARADLLQTMRQLRDNPDEPDALARLRQFGKETLTPDRHAMAVYDADRREVMEFGDFSESSEIAAELPGDDIDATLFWNGAAYLNSRLPIIDRDQLLGFIAVEQRLPLLNDQPPTASGQPVIAMCLARPDHFFCFPAQQGGHAQRIARLDEEGRALPLSRAVDSGSGVFSGPNGQRLAAVSIPLGASGLGLLAQQEVPDPYRPIYTHLAAAALLSASAAFAAWLWRRYRRRSGFNTQVAPRVVELLTENALLVQVSAEWKEHADDIRSARDVLIKAQELAHLGHWELDLRSGAIKWSDEFYRICGLEPQSAPAGLEAGFELLHHQDRDAARRALGDIFDGEADRAYQWRIVRPDRSVRRVMCQGVVMYSESGDPLLLVVSFLDIAGQITGSRRAKRAAAISE